MRWFFNAWRQAIALTAFGLLATGLTTTTQAATLNLIATADAQITENRGGSAVNDTLEDLNDNDNDFYNRNYSSSNASATTVRHESGILRFPLGPLTAALNAGETIESVALSITSTIDRSSNNYIRLYGLRDAQDGDWDETTVTYGNAPGLFPDTVSVYDTNNVLIDVENDNNDEYNSGTHQQLDFIPLGGTDADLIATPFGVTRLDGGAAVSANIPQIYSSDATGSQDGLFPGLLEFIELAASEGDESITLYVRANRASTQSNRYFTKDATTIIADGNGYAVDDPLPDAFKPQLIVETVGVPEPSSIAMVGLGIAAFGLASYRRHQSRG